MRYKILQEVVDLLNSVTDTTNIITEKTSLFSNSKSELSISSIELIDWITLIENQFLIDFDDNMNYVSDIIDKIIKEGRINEIL